jgi:1-acyl-sn-glycerol-3-phosphate acyltransferase
MLRRVRWIFSVVLGAFRTVLLGLTVVPVTIVLGTFVIIVARFNPRSQSITWAMRTWGRLFMVVCGVRTTMVGTEHLDENRSYLFVSNHLSNIDPPFHIAKIPASIRFLAKKELFKVPLLGAAMRSIGIVETDRQARASAHRLINEGVARVIDLGVSLIIYPEGTRSRDGEFHAFKKGAFRIAIDNGLTVVPITIRGTREVWTPGYWFVRGGKVTMVFHEPIPTAAMGPEDIDTLRDRVHGIIGAMFEELRGA